MKKILIVGFPHCGTSILRCIIGRCSNVEEQFVEEYNPILNNNVSDKEFYLMKIPLTKKEFFTKDYDNIIKIFIIRNPIFVISSINKRFSYNSIPDNHNIDHFIDTLELFINCKNNNYKNTYTIRYEDLFINNYYNLKKIFNEIGFKYSNEIFTNKVDTVSGWPKECMPKSKPENTDHSRYRVWQNSQPFISNNDLSKIDLNNIQKKKILKSKTIKDVYPEIKYLLFNDKNIIPFDKECYTTQSIDLKFSKNIYKKCAFLFDYIGDTYTESIYDNLIYLLNLNINICHRDDFCLKLFDNKYFTCHQKYDFKYFNYIQTNNNKININDAIQTFIEKYNRKNKRLKYYLKNYDFIIILSVNNFDNIFYKKNNTKQNTIYKLLNLLKLYNNNIKFISILFLVNIYIIYKICNFVNLPL